jgi:glyoxylase-like metal-dependent hydrolase (beta-lactamase superfamily II)
MMFVFQSSASGFNTNTYFYDDGREVVAFDAQFTPETATEALAFLRTKTQSPVKYLVVTHPNPDKFNGIEVFKKAGATVVASQATAAAMPKVHEYKKAFFVGAKMFTEESYPKLGTIDRTFTGALDLTLASGAKVELRELAKPGVSSTQTVAYLPAENALVVGDLVHHKAHAWLENGTVASWIEDLAEIKARWGAKDPAILGGRGEKAALSAAIPAQIDYLKKADQLVTEYVAAKGDLKDYSKLQKTFEATWPDYALGYMIGYGVYGLAIRK